MLDAVERVGGVSAGSITATVLSVGYTGEEIEDIIFFTDFSDFNGGQYMFVGGDSRMVDSYGWTIGSTRD